MREHERALRLEELSDECMQKKKYGEAVLHLTHAIKLQPKITKLYEKRSTAFLLMNQPYYAYEDAKELVSLEPNNPMSYLKKASIEYETGNYRQALDTYRLIDDDDDRLGEEADLDVEEFLNRCLDKLERQESYDKNLPWIGAAIGLIFGITIVSSDYIFFVNNGFFHNPLMKVAFIISNSVIFFQSLKTYRRYLLSCRKSLLQPPPRLFSDGESEADSSSNAFDRGRKWKKS
ncbi:uncharacterized protein LOC141855144 [Brevipalpus obovatus]|uniref:uncharacterized protein LOC141855144 n=1 Tax=Brevipalpus obovatus TaxID=246614 RepID=UPI003D9DEEDF